MYATILAATDGSAGAQRAVDRAIDLASLFNADLYLLFVVDTGQFDTDKPEEATEQLLDDLEAEGRETLGDLEAQAYDSSVQYVETEVRRGVPHAEVLAAVDAHDAELVVLGTHDADGHERVHLGSTAAEVARRVDPPLLLV